MSTRANIVITQYGESLYYYQHSDGYPKGVLPTLTKLVKGVVKGKFRNDLSQLSGWLIAFGRQALKKDIEKYPESSRSMYTWKVGYIEPTTQVHGDSEYVYTLNLDDNTICIKDVFNKSETKLTFEDLIKSTKS